MLRARVPAENPEANLKSYEAFYRDFDWRRVEEEFTWSETGRLNIAHEAVDRWAAVPDHRDRPALVFEQNEKVQVKSFAELKAESCKWANFLAGHGFEPGDRLFIFLPPCPEIYLAMLACARAGLVFCPLYATLSYDELMMRLKNGQPRGVLTHPDLVEHLPPAAVDEVEHLFLTAEPSPGLFRQESFIGREVGHMSPEFETRWAEPDSPLFLLYTSGSTGPPKGIVHGHGDMTGHLATARYALDLGPDSVLWTDGNPGWVTGTVYGAFAPWLCGVTSVILGDSFQAGSWYRTLERHKVTTWYTTPRTLKRLALAGEDLPHRYDFSHLRHIATVGESLPPELFFWIRKNLKHTPHETWWMTETGMICLANFPSLEAKPGSMGRPVPGVKAAVLDDEGQPLPLLSMGELALKTGWPSQMIGLWRDEERSRAYFRRKGWFLTGDMAIVDEEGYFYHQGRNDDLIKIGDQLVGPYDIEQVILLHPAVADAAVIALPNRPPGQAGGVPNSSPPLLKAFVKTGPGRTPSTRLGLEIKALIKANLSADTPIKEVEFIDELPKTASGKLLRRVLRARELGLPSGDTAKLRQD